METDDEFIFCLDLSAQECWEQLIKWAKPKCQVPKLKKQLREFSSVLGAAEFASVEPDRFVAMSCALLPHVSGSRPYVVFCIVRLVQELAVSESLRAAVSGRMLELTEHVIEYLKQGLDSEDVKNLLGAAVDVVRLLLARGEAPLADYLCLFLAAAGAASTPLEVTRQLMATTNQLLEPLQRAQRSAVRTQLDEQLPALLRLLTTCGDYDVQASLVECLFRLSTHPERPLLAAAWLPSDELRAAFVAIANFDPDCRQLLNAFNRRLGAERKVHSFPAESVTLAGYALEKPDDPDYHHMWVDFNEGSGTVTVYCQRPVTETQPDETLWETVTVRRSDVARARLRLDRHHQLVTLTLDRPCRQLLASGALETFDGSEAALTFRKGHDLHTVLGRLYGGLYKFQACEELGSERVQKASATIRGVQCRPTAAAPAPSATTASSSAGGSRAPPRQKASVPLSTVSSSGPARPPARRPVAAPKSSVPVLAGQRATGGGRYSPLEMSSPGRELHRQRTSPAAETAPAEEVRAEAPPAKAAPAEVAPVSQSSGTSVIEPTPRPAAGASSGPSTPGVSSTAQACVRTPSSRRKPDASPADQRAAKAGGDRRGPAEKRQQQQRRAQEVAASTDSEAQRHGDQLTEEEQEEQEEQDGPQPQEEHEPQPEDDDGSEIQDDEQQASDEDRRDEEGELQIDESEQEGGEDDVQQMASEDEPEPEPEQSQTLHQRKRDKQRGTEHESHEDAGTEDQHGERKNKKTRPAPPPEQPQSSPDFEPSPRASEPTSAADQSPPPAPVPATAAASRPAAGRASKQADRSVASIESRQRASRRPRAATRPTYVEIESSPGDKDEQDSQSSFPSQPEPQRRPAARDLNNNTTTAPAAEEEDEESWWEDRHGSRDPEPAAEPPRHTERAAPPAREKKQTGKAAAGKAARGKQAQSSAPAAKRQKPRPSVSFQEQDTGRDAKRKRSLFLHKDSSNDDSPRHVQHSIFSQSDSADSEVDAPRHRATKRSRYPPRSPHIFSDIGGTSTDGERLPPSPPQPQRHVGTFSRYPVYDPRSSVRNKALLSQEEAGQAEVSQRGARGRGRGGRGRRGAASKRGAASARGAGASRGRGSAAGRGATSSGVAGRGATSAKRGVSQSQPAGGWADRVSREERRLQSPEMLRDEPAPPVDEHALSDAEVPPAKRRADRDLAARFGWDSAESESAAPLEVELSPPVPPAPNRAAPRRTSARQRRTPEQREPEEHAPAAEELELSEPHEPGAELELSQPPAPPVLDASAVSAGHVSHLSVSATESAPALACPPNTPLSAGKRVAPAAPTAAQLGDAIQWQAASPQRARPPPRHAAALTATQEFRLEDHLVLESEASRPVSPAPVDLSQHITDSPLPSPIRGPGGEVASVSLPPPPPPAHVPPQRAAAPPASSQPAGEFRPPLPPPPPVSYALDRRALPAAPLSLTTDDIRAELSGMVADWDTTSVRSDQAQYHHQQQAGGAAAVLQAVAAIRRQVSRLEERDERLHQLGRRSAATQETLLTQQRAAVATLERLSEAAASARRQAAERILTECERLERTASAGPVPPAHAPAPAPAAAAAGGGVESELQSVQRELELLLQASDAQPQPQWYRY